jgi:hypothetical protein
VRFYLDENLAEGIAAAARRLGVDVVGSQATGMNGTDDASQLAFAVQKVAVSSPLTTPISADSLTNIGAPDANISGCSSCPTPWIFSGITSVP